MGKAKKGKRTDKDDFGSDLEVENSIIDEPVKSKKSKDKKKVAVVDELAENLEDLKIEKSKKKDKKSKRKGGDSDDEDILKGKIELGSDSEEAPKSKKKNTKNQSVKKGFAALAIESDENESDNENQKLKVKSKKGKEDIDVDDEEDDVKPSKSKNKKKNRKQVDSDGMSDDESQKPKSKGKKGKKAIDSDDDLSDNQNQKAKSKGKKSKKTVESDASADEEPKTKIKNKSNAKKKSKNNDSDQEMDIGISKPKTNSKEKKVKKDSDLDDDDDDFHITKTKTVKPVTKSKASKASFAMLMQDDQDDDDDDNQASPPSDDESERTESRDNSKSSKIQKPQPQESKKSKKAKKKRDDDDDFDKILEEFKVVEEPKPEEESDEGEKKKKKGKQPKKEKEADETAEGQEEGTVKTAAQKKKEKKEREKQKKLAQKKAEAMNKTEAPKGGDLTEPAKKEATEEPKVEDKEEDDDDDEKKKKKKDGKDDPKKKVKGPGAKAILKLKEALKLEQEREEQLKREEEERIRQEEERERLREEQLKREQEKKEKKKLKEKMRKDKLKAEGKLLSSKQKFENARAQAMLEALKAQGFEVPEVGEKKQRPGTRVRASKLKQQSSKEEKEENKAEEAETDKVQVEIVDKKEEKAEEKKEEEDDGLKDAWDAESSEEEPEEDKSESAEKKEAVKGSKTAAKESEEEESSSAAEGSDSESESSDSDSDDESEEESDGKRPDPERKKQQIRERIQNRKNEAEKKRTLDRLRAAVVCVLGHVDTGKTKILDKLRRTNVQDGEAGGITQQIGATNVPISAIQESTKHVKGFADKKFKIPGLLIIDTPGHESFSNLRNRGSSLCDIAILVVDIMHGLEPQTIESINLLKAKKCPFVVALNKIDRLYDWQTMSRKDVQDIIKAQAINTQREFEKRSKDIIVQFAEQGLNAALFYENPDSRSYVSLVPTSAVTGEGMGNLLGLIVDACQGPLAKRLMFCEELHAIVLEVKALPGLGTTIDCILVNGTLREGDTMILAGTDGPIVTQIRALLMPQPLKELRVKNAYVEHKEIEAAQGVKIAAKELEKAIAGLNLVVAQKPDEVEILKEEIAKELSHALGKIKLAERGVYVQASTLGALEALLEFLRTSKIPYAGIRIGPVVKKDVMKASIMLEHDDQFAVILAFDVKVERDAQELADSLGVTIFAADIIYHLFDKFIAHRDNLKARKREEFKHIAVFPCKLKFVELGIVTSIESNHKNVESARKGQEVCIKIEPIPGESPKMYGRHFDEKDMLISKISRASIDACKEYFRDDLIKADWQLMVELKKLFQIL
ncbi:eukaryotic translation initiation factor 5B [Copidosoma floridanum]|uniref:eukaryotic translation initiation factor 5B n=1 Tax=Copidosoma floridanum TaxID=29053 RepID=UPI000C6F8284|nr:eukaryotic translation initiation factor 5B [Copidosoma floridanum]